MNFVTTMCKLTFFVNYSYNLLYTVKSRLSVFVINRAHSAENITAYMFPIFSADSSPRYGQIVRRRPDDGQSPGARLLPPMPRTWYIL